ncbi:MAG: thioredoxin domain-containing protein [Bacteroidia bacterium]|nr:MAG: thioredoxin domain-containing protein [Bacteroidia bacterium]
MPKPNHLKEQTSPYLLQHLYNPVDWYPWGEEALEKAKRENKPLLVSIGYSACHWCHVMEKESFEDNEVAYLMNSSFVCIKVDREERPDIDHLYMNAVQLVSGQGGWPLNCFALPDGRPFWGGTYFPKEQWKNILARITELYNDNYDDVLKQADNLTKGVSGSSFVAAGNDKPAFDKEDVRKMMNNLLEYMDDQEGGTKGAPKFPLPNNHAFLLHYYGQNGDQKSLDQVNISLHKMAMGGIYDQIGGGFARYSTDIHWKVPHFEKMLYDNGQLVSLYANAWKLTRKPLYKDVVYETVSFVDRELTSPDGVFFSALDADSEGEEGKYYVWKAAEVDSLLGDDAPWVKDYFRIGDKGLWENGNNILLRDKSDEAFAQSMDLDAGAFRGLLSKVKEKMLIARSKRVKPGLDDKVLVSWNALMIEGLADAYAAFEDEAFLNKASNAADFLLQHAMEPDGKLYRTVRGKRPAIDGFLEDYALFGSALIRLYQVSGNAAYANAAKKLTEYVMRHFREDGTNLFYFSSQRSEKLAAPHYEFYDNVIPSSNSVMARVLFYLAHYYENPEWGQQSSKMLNDMKERLDKYSSSFSNWGILLMHHTQPFHTIVITGPQAFSAAKEMGRHYLPNVLIAAAKNESQAAGLPVFENRFVKEKTLIYPCLMGRCKLPVETVEDVLKQLQ